MRNNSHLFLCWRAQEGIHILCGIRGFRTVFDVLKTETYICFLLVELCSFRCCQATHPVQAGTGTYLLRTCDLSCHVSYFSSLTFISQLLLLFGLLPCLVFLMACSVVGLSGVFVTGCARTSLTRMYAEFRYHFYNIWRMQDLLQLRIIHAHSTFALFVFFLGVIVSPSEWLERVRWPRTWSYEFRWGRQQHITQHRNAFYSIKIWLRPQSTGLCSARPNQGEQYSDMSMKDGTPSFGRTPWGWNFTFGYA